MWQIIISLWIGGFIGVMVMALMNISRSSDDRLALLALKSIIEAQHKAIKRLYTTLVDLLHQSTGPDWDYELCNGLNRAFLTKVVATIESINIVEDKQNGTDN